MAWAPDYVTADELAVYSRIADDDDDAQLALAVSAASRAIDRHCRRQFGQEASAVARYYTPYWDLRRGRWVVQMDDLMTTTGLVVKADLDDSGDYESTITAYALKPVNAQRDGQPWEQIVVLPTSTVYPVAYEHSVEITARWGWTSVPTTIKQAAFLQASRFFKRRGSPFGIAGSPEMGNELRLLAKLDADVEVMLRPYRRMARPR